MRRVPFGLCALSLCGTVYAVPQAAQSALSFPAPRIPPGVARAAGARAEVLYVADAGNATVVLFNARSEAVSPQPIGRIFSGITKPVALTTDVSGNLFVANAATRSVAANVEMYTPGATSPSVTYTSGITDPVGVAVDDRETLYVANGTSKGQGPFLAGPAVVAFAPGSTAPSAVLYDANAQSIGAVGVDARQNVYVSYLSYLCCPASAIDELVPGPRVPLVLAIADPRPRAPTNAFSGLILDGAGNLVAVNGSAVFGYAPSMSTWPTIEPPTFTLSVRGSPVALALDTARTRLFLGDGTNDEVLAYSYPAGTPQTIFSVSLFEPVAVAVGPAAKPPRRMPQPPPPPKAAPPPPGIVYLTGQTALSLRDERTLRRKGTIDIADFPVNLAVDFAQHFYVMLSTVGQVDEFNAGSTVPFQTFSQGLTSGGGVLAVGSDETLVVAQPKSLVVYPQGGQVPESLPTPSGTLALKGATIDSSGNLYVSATTTANGAEVAEYTANAGGYDLPQTVLASKSLFGAMTLDASGSILVSVPAGIAVYPPGQNSLSILIGSRLVAAATSLTLDATQHFLFVATTGLVYAFRYPEGTPYAWRLQAGRGVAVSPPAPPGSPWTFRPRARRL